MSELGNNTAESDRRQGVWAVVRMSLPIVIANSCRMLMDVSDYWMISRTGNTDASAAILPTQMIMWSYMVLGMGMLSIVTTLASQSLGRGQLKNCSGYAWQCLYLSGVFWIVGALLWPFLPRVFAWVGNDPAIQDLQLRYARIAVWTIGPTIAASGLSSFFNGIHRPTVTMLVALEGIVVNAAVSYVLIFGKLGAPAMGIEGAAWGTVVGTAYRAIRLTSWLCVPSMHNRFDSRSTWRPDWQKMVSIFRFGGPAGLQWCSDVTVWAIFTAVLVGSYFTKTDQLATNAAWQYLRVSFIPCIGIGMALSSMVGKAIGAKRPDEAIRVTRIATTIMIIYMAVFSLVFLIWREGLIAFFTDDPAVVEIGAKVMICAAVFQIFDALGIGYNSALRGAGDTFAPSVVFIVSHWVIVIGGGFLVAELRPDLGSIGPWMAASVLIIFIGLYLWWRWNRRKWMSIDVFKHEKRESRDAEESFIREELGAEAG
jgi:MATE family, multidrug efflux pump